MRIIDLWLNRASNELVQGINAGNLLGDLAVAQDDSIEFRLHNLQRNTAIPALTPFVEKPLEFSSARVAIGTIDTAPSSGTFKLRVDGQATPALTWPADLSTPELIVAWKLSVLDALKALSTVGSTGVIAVDPPVSVAQPGGTPAHFLYFQWTDAASTLAIEVVQAKLQPWIDPVVRRGFVGGGFTQIVKLAQGPLAFVADFERAASPVATIIQTRGGGIGANEEQTLVIPTGTMGSLSLQWAAASTKTLAISTLSAPALAAALNAIVPNGVTAPSFRVEERAQRAGKRFAIEFIGPLAAAAQDEIGVSMHDQEAVAWASGTLNLQQHLGIERALNGQTKITLKLEIVIVEDGEETFLRDIAIVNDMTNGGVVESAEKSGAALVVERIVYVDSGLGTPYVQGAAGASFSAGAAGSTLVITHGLGTWRPEVTVTLYEVDHTIFASDPTDLAAATTGSRSLKDTEYGEHASSENIISIALPWALVNDPTNPLDYRLLKVDIASPDSALHAFDHQHTYDTVRDTLPSGQTLRAKLAALEAAVGIIAGAIAISTTHLTGVVRLENLDLTAISNALTTNAAFATTLQTLLGGNTTLINTIGTALGNSTTFASTLATILKTSREVLDSLTTGLSTNVQFSELLDARLNALLTGLGGSFPPGVVPMLIPDFELQIPRPRQIASNSTVTATGATQTTTQNEPVNQAASGGTKTESSGVTTQSATTTTTTGGGATTTTTPLTTRTLSYITTYAALEPALAAGAWTDAGGISGVLPATATLGAIYTVTTPGAESRGGERRGQSFSTDKKITFAGGHWYEVAELGGAYYPAEVEQELFTLQVTAQQLYIGSVFALNAAPWLQLQCAAKTPLSARAELVLESGVRASSSGGASDLLSVTWTPRLTLPVFLTPAQVAFPIGLTVRRTADATFAASLAVNGQSSSAGSWTTANFGLRLRLSKFDLADSPATQRGSLSVRMAGARAGISPIV